MNAIRYRIGIDRTKMSSWSGWYSDYEPESDAPIVLANAIERDLRKFRIYEVKPNADLSLTGRKEIIRKALLALANEYLD